MLDLDAMQEVKVSFCLPGVETKQNLYVLTWLNMLHITLPDSTNGWYPLIAAQAIV